MEFGKTVKLIDKFKFGKKLEVRVSAMFHQWMMSIYMVIPQNVVLHLGEGDLILFDKIHVHVIIGMTFWNSICSMRYIYSYAYT